MATDELGALDQDGERAAIRLVLADDHAVVRSGLRMLLDSEPGFEVVAEARYVRGHHPARARARPERARRRATIRVVSWGAVAMAITSAIGAAVGTIV